MGRDYKIGNVMGLLLSVNHLLNFLAPALALALAVPLAGRWTGSPVAWPRGYWRQCLLHLLLGLAALTAGIWLGGRDSMMASYAALVLVTATTQWGMALVRRS